MRLGCGGFAIPAPVEPERRPIRTVSVATLAAVLVVAGSAVAFTDTRSGTIIFDGQDFTFTFSSLRPAVGDVTVTVGVTGDFDTSDAFASISVDGSFVGTNQGAGECDGVVHSESFTVPASTVDDEELVVFVDLTSNVHNICSPQFVEVTVEYTEDLAVPAVSTVGVFAGGAGMLVVGVVLLSRES